MSILIKRTDPRAPKGSNLVCHKETGKILGNVTPSAKPGDSKRTIWLARLPEGLAPLDESRIGPPGGTAREAAQHLLNPESVRPPVTRRLCQMCECFSSLTPIDDLPCLDCDPEDEAQRRSQEQHPQWWAHYDDVRRLCEES